MEVLKAGHIAAFFLILLALSAIVVQYDVSHNINMTGKSGKIDDGGDRALALSPGNLAQPAAAIPNSTVSMLETIARTATESNHQPPNEIELSSPQGANSILPKKVYSVIGLESSGTQFVTGMLRDALGLASYREGSFGYRLDTSDVQVQHFSLPWGSTCQAHPNVPVLDVVLPSQCSKLGGNPQCRDMTQNIWGLATKHVKYPPRYNLNIVTHKEAMEALGVEQYFIIVVRDPSISRKARKLHCGNRDLLLEEEEVGREIILEAINKYILETEKTGKKATNYDFKFWNAANYQGFRHPTRHRRLRSGRKLLSPNSIPMGNNIILVSYESILFLREPYIKMIYEALGIQSNFIPNIHDGNTKYIGV